MSEQEVYQYTIMPTHLKKRFDLEELKDSVFHPGFNFMKNIPLFKIPVNLSNLELTNGFVDSDHLLYDLKKDPKQEAPLKSDNIEKLDQKIFSFFQTHQQVLLILLYFLHRL